MNVFMPGKISLIVHELEPKKWVFGSGRWTFRLLVTSGVRIGSFWPKIKVFYRPE